jgi:hypothetical protein
MILTVKSETIIVAIKQELRQLNKFLGFVISILLISGSVSFTLSIVCNYLPSPILAV